MKKKMEAALIAAFSREFKDEIAQSPTAAASHRKLAAAISDIAMTIVEELLTSAEIAPGIPVATAGSPAAQSGSTVGPGKIV
jgi:hypothetical protein